MAGVKDSQPRRSKRLTVSERNLQKAASRLLPLHARLVSTEVEYLKRHLGISATQEEIDESVLNVRKMPWSSLLEE